MTEPTRDALHAETEERETEATAQWLLREARRSGRTLFEMDNLRYAAECVRVRAELQAEVERLRAKAAIVDAMERGEIRVDTGHYNNGDVWVSTKDGDFRGPTITAAYAAATREGTDA